MTIIIEECAHFGYFGGVKQEDLKSRNRLFLGWGSDLIPDLQLNICTTRLSRDTQGRFIHKAEEAEASGPTKPRAPQDQYLIL